MYSIPTVESSSLLRSLEHGLLTLALNRPERRNALSPELRDELMAALDEAALAAEVRAVVITGDGGSFCAGGDLGRFDELHDPAAYRWVSHRLTALMDAVERFEKPTIAVINGIATGAGLTLALACDWRIGTEKTRILWREGQIGLIATHGGIARLVKLVGLARARELMLGGEDLDPDAALASGLISEIAAGDGREAAAERAEKMLGRLPLSYAAAKRVLCIAADSDTQTAIAAESLAQTALLQSEEHHQALTAARARQNAKANGRSQP